MAVVKKKKGDSMAVKIMEQKVLLAKQLDLVAAGREKATELRNGLAVLIATKAQENK
jgi:hypothetical protein